MARNHKQIKLHKMTNKTQTQLSINGFTRNSIAYLESMGLSQCFEAYASIGEEIIEGGIGFNPNSGYTYIALENGISICSMMGGECEYLVYDSQDEEEHFFNTYEEATNYQPYEEETED
jgi:hypothetical protein